MSALSRRAAASPITDRSVLHGTDYFVFAVLTLLIVGAMAAFLEQWFRFSGRGVASIPFWIATLVLARGFSHYLMRWFLLLLMRRPTPLPPQRGLRVAVVTTFVPGAEPLDMLKATVRGAVAMDYPHDTWVLDEGDDPEVRALCERLGAHHFSRKDRPAYHTSSGTFQTRSKHGNYNAFLYELGFDHYDVVMGLDPDHIPEPWFLMRVLGYFRDEAVGYVQAAQVYYNQAASFIARGAAEETYAFYSSTQMANYTLGHPVVNGCHQAHRVTALREVGGFAPHNADDLLITLLYRAAGWRGVYVPEVLARGLVPVDWAGYIKQQFRWAHSTLDVKFWVYPRLAGKMSPLDRGIALLHGLYYLQGVTALFGLLLLLGMLLTGFVPAFVNYTTAGSLAALYVVLRGAQLYKQWFFLERPTEWGWHWRAAVLGAAKWPVFLIAFVEAALRRKRPYSITAKVASAKERVLLPPHLLIIVLTTLAWAGGMMLGHPLHPLLHLWAAITVATSGGLIWTERWTYPPPYDPALRRARPEAARMAAA